MRLLTALVTASLSAAPAAQSVATERDVAVDQIFAAWTSSTPGCAVGVAVAGKTVLLKAYGMADLDHDVRNTPDTIFEGGSLAKQFTAMAVALLAHDGKLSLDDPVRKYVPELPDYGKPLTIRHMLNHTSGLRDWGSVASIAGWPRTTREYTHAHVLDIVSRQKSLNFDPGMKWSYSNTGFNLSAIIVARVSGMPFAQFSKQRIFDPLGMKHTSWRDDHTRIVKNRAVAYSLDGGDYKIEMPFENVHGNGGILTTVGDLLTWNENFVTPKVGNPKLIAEMTNVGHFNDGKPLSYGLGLFVVPLGGSPNVYHSGSTAGYRAHLNRFPEDHLSVAVLCNGSNGGATLSANLVSLSFLGGVPPGEGMAPPADPREPPPPPPAGSTQLTSLAGDYWSDEAETTLTVVVSGNEVSLRRRPDAVINLTRTGPDTFRGSIGMITFIRSGSGAVEALSVNQDRVWDLRFTKR